MTSPLLYVMTSAARKAARILLRDFGEVEHLRYSVKGSGDFVSASDLRTEEILCVTLQEARPEFDILAEERGLVRSKTPSKDGISKKWIIDSLDGTRNFIHGFPIFAISLAAQEGDEIIAGLIYAPLTDELFTAQKGEGAFMNNQRIRVSSCRKLEASLFAYGRGGEFREKLMSVGRGGGHMRQLGSVALALAYVASARLDGFLSGESKIWDIAAGMIIIREAGGIVSALDGKPINLSDNPTSFIASTASLHSELLK